MSRPRIGVPRVYDGDSIPTLYPGEQATAQVAPETLLRAIATGATSVPVTGWLVEPMPGWHAWWLRLRYRIWGRWFSTGTPHLELTATLDRKE